MRLALALLFAGCLDKPSPTLDHHVEYTLSGLSDTGPATYRARADLDTRMLEISIPGDPITTPTYRTTGPNKVTSKPLSQAEVDELRLLAAAARHEPPGPEAGVSDSLEELTFDGEPWKRVHNSRLNTPVAMRLRERLRSLAGW